jgi:hypothetical protein
VVVGIGATVLAAVQIAAWIAIGLFANPGLGDEGLDALIALLVGSGVTAAVYAALAYAGSVDAAIWLCALAGVGAVVAQRRRLQGLFRWFGQVYADAAGPRPITRILLVLVGLGLWIDAIVPPRDADVMRYHLAHVRQIIREQRWVPLPDYHYALPFGWSLNYLPFERAHLPEGAQVLNLLVWVLVLAVMTAWLRRRQRGHRNTWILVVGVAISLQPLVVKTITTALADAYCLLVMLTVGLLIMRLTELGGRQMAMLGFAAWIGAQSRYQLVAVGLVVGLLLVHYATMHRIAWSRVATAAAGGAFALLLAAPFYLANLRALRNPVWPLLIPEVNRGRNYADRVGQAFSASLEGSYAPAAVAASIRDLVTDPRVFPIPILIAIVFIAALCRKSDELRRLAELAALFTGLWFLMQPSLYHRFVLFYVPVVILALATFMIEAWDIAVIRRVAQGALVSGVAVFAAFDIVYSADAVRYVATHDVQAYHRATWFYPVYTWANDSTAPAARFLVVVTSGHSYYLDRWYRRADPRLSGTVDWDAISTPRQLHDLVLAQRFDYLIYDDRDCSGVPGGSNMMRVIAEARRQHYLVTLRTFDVPLVTGRVLGTGERAHVLVLRPST